MRATILFMFVLLTNCTSIHPLANQTLTRENLIAQLNTEEDRIWVLKKDGEDYRNLIIDSIEETYLLCHNKEADILIIPYSLIEKLEIYQFSTAKTIVLGIPVVFLIVLVITCSTAGCGVGL